MPIGDELARRLKTEREGRRLSQQDLASKLGVAPNTVSRWETGTYTPRLDDLDRIAAALGMDVSQLMPQYSGPTRTSLDRLIDAARLLDAREIEEVRRFAEFRRAQSLDQSKTHSS
jgi:transcriptional regulator with XRE-family HTH domain